MIKKKKLTLSILNGTNVRAMKIRTCSEAELSILFGKRGEKYIE